MVFAKSKASLACACVRILVVMPLPWFPFIGFMTRGNCNLRMASESSSLEEMTSHLGTGIKAFSRRRLVSSLSPAVSTPKWLVLQVSEALISF